MGTTGGAAGRFDWRPSGSLVALLTLLGVLAAASVLASAMPPALAWPAAVVAAVHGAWLAWREAHRPRLRLRLYGSGAVEVDGKPVEDLRVAWRGPLVFASWLERDGRRRHRVWGPGTLAPAARRELRLAVPAEGTARPEAPVAH